MKSLTNVPRKPVILIILDGVGENPAKANNAVVLAKTPKLDKYFSKNPISNVIQVNGNYWSIMHADAFILT